MNSRIKILLLICFLQVVDFSYSQVRMPEIDSIKPNLDKAYQNADTIFLPVGEKILVQQLCNPNVSKDLAYISMGFRELYIKNMTYRAVIFFEDTLVTKAIYYYEGRDMAPAFKLFGLDKNNFERSKWFTFHYSEVRDDILINCWFDRKSFFYQEEIVKTE